MLVLDQLSVSVIIREAIYHICGIFIGESNIWQFAKKITISVI